MEFTELFDAIASQNWPLVVALGLTIVVYLARGIVKDKIPKKYVPWITLSVAVVSSIAARMVEHINANHPWWYGLVQGLPEGAIIGFGAMGWWSTANSLRKRK